jgi:hypothetical protein
MKRRRTSRFAVLARATQPREWRSSEVLGAIHGTTMRTIIGSILAASTLAACGGGGSDSSSSDGPATSAQGLWTGTTSTNRTVTGLVLSDGSYYVLYSPVGSPTLIAGVVQGSGTSSGGSFASSNAKDFNLEGFGVLPATIAATYTSKQSFGGTIAYSGSTSTTFTTHYDANYESAPSLAALAGTFSGQVASSAGTQTSTVTISANGAITTDGSSGCSTSGTVSPRTDGNAYNVSLTFGPSPCVFANQTLSGVAYFNSAIKRLYAAAPNSARTDGILFVGTKP